MNSKTSHFFIGLFVVTGIIGIFITGLWLAKSDSSEKTTLFEIHFEESVPGLNVGSRVSYRGIGIGHVSYIGIKPDNPQLVQVRINIRDVYQIHQGDVASLKLEGITGTSYINIEGAQPGSTVMTSSISNPTIIPSQKSELEKLVQGAPQLITQGTILAQRFSEIFNQTNREQLESILYNINSVTSSLAEQNDNISNVFTTINSAGAEFSTLSFSLNGVIGKLDTLADKLAITADNTNELILIDARHLIKEWADTANSLETLTEKANNVLAANEESLQQFSGEGLNEFTHFLQEARILVAGLTRVVDRIESSGARFLLDQSTSEITPD